MYCPPHFQENSLAALVNLIEGFPLATIIHNSANGLTADHIPLVYEAAQNSKGRLLGHIAKNNPLWQIAQDQELLAVFQGPSTYISPNLYATKLESGRVVPTWNYAVVHAHCSLKAIHDPTQVLQIVTRLTDQCEATQSHPWRVADAPPEFTNKLLANTMGIELTIKRLQGKWKVSQNQPPSNQQSVAQGLLEAGSEVPNQMAQLIRAYGTE
ncbi:PaiB family negative transcriptional regulator [Azomonas agilis]|uniref:PaiB family negative transcriptional regulator n=1 Tax=Azomonas agilis TaxID=116849 RepID=A0A562IZZ8_9GAMM|nr:FMN-binding negative transcriptional regulator [Azomonas agilis]TWH76105.1 PaiB family negative transcriptional regulator [Azomonas agilis]